MSWNASASASSTITSTRRGSGCLDQGCCGRELEPFWVTSPLFRCYLDRQPEGVTPERAELGEGVCAEKGVSFTTCQPRPHPPDPPGPTHPPSFHLPGALKCGTP